MICGDGSWGGRRSSVGTVDPVHAGARPSTLLLGTILDTTLRSISDFAAGRPLANEIAASA
jgi:hypothetical protein